MASDIKENLAKKVIHEVQAHWGPKLAEVLANKMKGSSNAPDPNVIGWLPTDINTPETAFICDLTKKLICQKLVRKVEYCVPLGIVKGDLTVVVEDFKVDSRRQPDDKVYSDHSVLRLHIPRGLTVIHLTDKDFNSSSEVVIYGNKKFTGCPVDEDNDVMVDQDWKQFFIKPYESATKILCMEKINGEAAHISGRYIKDTFYFISGSKNVHMIFNCTDHIEMYIESRFDVAKEIAYRVMAMWSELDMTSQTCIKTFLHCSKSTIICEVLRTTSQHIVEILRDEIIAFCIPPPPVKESSNVAKSLTYINPLHTLELLKLLGFKTPKYEMVDVIDIDEKNKNVRQSRYTEGEVQYFMNADNDTIGLSKVKSLWYILIRAIRQQTLSSYFVKRHDPDLEIAKTRLTKRFKEFLPWLNISEEKLHMWTLIGHTWLAWLYPQIDSYTRQSLFDKFPTVWIQFENEYDIIYDT